MNRAAGGGRTKACSISRATPATCARVVPAGAGRAFCSGADLKKSLLLLYVFGLSASAHAQSWVSLSGTIDVAATGQVLMRRTRIHREPALGRRARISTETSIVEQKHLEASMTERRRREPRDRVGGQQIPADQRCQQQQQAGPARQ